MQPLDAPLPPLNALRAFEATARLGSMTRAAEELHVTQTAVSHQVRQLEAHLSRELFRRAPGGLVLTPYGSEWAAALHDVFARLFAAHRRLRTRPARPTVSLTVLPSFAGGWLVPRLGRFLAAHPGVDVHISPSERLVDLEAEDYDVGIRYGRAARARARAVTLLEDAWGVVAAPEIARRHGLRQVSDLSRAPLLRDDDPEAWDEWLASRGVTGVDWRRGAELTDSSLVVDAAVRGQGVALARLSLAYDALESGRLVEPFAGGPLVRTGWRYTMAVKSSRQKAPEVRAFGRWVMAELTPLRARVAAAPARAAARRSTRARRLR